MLKGDIQKHKLASKNQRETGMLGGFFIEELALRHES